ncbi:hypothetical protein C1646_776142, partial [Rhizophagus diaphanus]
MYCKRLRNFQSYHHGPHPTSKKQRSRFERACQSVFTGRRPRFDKYKNTRQNKHTPSDDIKDKLRQARMHRFLFLPSQHINKPIQHLKYHKNSSPYTPTNYNHPIPPQLTKASPAEPNQRQVYKQDLNINQVDGDPSHNFTTDDHPMMIDSTQTEGSSTKPPVQTRSKEGHTWHENLGIFIPNDLLPYVTEDPVYINKTQERKKGKHYPPGHKEWFAAIKVRKQCHEQRIAREQYEKELSARAKLWGTSTNSIEYREGM